MSVDIRLPQFHGNEKEQLTQVGTYLYQLASQLQWALRNVDASNNIIVQSSSQQSGAVVQPLSTSLLSDETVGRNEAEATFESIKSLIIKSAEIVDAYYDEINTRLEGLYVAQSDFGEFRQRTEQTIEQNSTSTTQRFENIQVIISNQGNDLSTIEGDLKTIGEDLSYAHQSIVSLGSNIEALDGSIASVEGEIGALDTSLKTAKADLQNKVETTKTELEGSIDNAKSELSGRVEGVDADLQESKSATNARIDDTNGSVAGLGESLNDANSRIADVDQDLQDSKETINNSIQGVQDSVTGVNALLEDAKATLQGSLEDIEVYVSELQNVIIGVTAYLKSGLLYYTDAGIPVYGLEIGQSIRDEVSGENVFNKYARFTSEKLSFYDNNGNEVAYISDKKLFIRIAEITIAFKIGGLMDLVMDNGDVVTKWVGKE